ncbi:acyl carrier protein [Luteimonas aestuarii]|uniref:Acyl carrier protein n=1 Tax=Luteimonas aestuarii TaxID=453837 RepID=A0A4R5U4E3_9GAMM|nr:acyl carrier protein [Luteimonas aestuarii]TDK28514.1 acyl carrier protein [Luteimonas aestuarii]
MSTTETLVRDFIATTFPSEDGSDHPADASLLEGGVIDSIGVLTLVTWIEEAFGFTVEDEDVLPENLDSIASIVAYIDRKQYEAGQAA